MSSSINETKSHIARINQIKQITNAMYLLAVGELQKQRPLAEYSRMHLSELKECMAGMIASANEIRCKNRFVKLDKIGAPLFLTVTSDKGLCGGFNNSVVQFSIQKLNEAKKINNNPPVLFCFGKRGARVFQKYGYIPDTVFPGSSYTPNYQSVCDLADTLIDMYVTNYVNEVYVVYTPFSLGDTSPKCERLLPLTIDCFKHGENENYTTQTEFEPNADSVFEQFVPQFCACLLYDVLVQSSAAENQARRTAMNTAMESADELLKKLQLELNTQRQVAITQEIAEISSASLIKKRRI